MKQINVLIVDDHALFSSGAAELIQNHFDARVTQISNPADVLKLPVLDFDVILTDIDMPDMNGIELIEKIRAQHHNQRILVVTMHNKPSLVKKCQALGVEGYIVKFDDNETFLEAIQTVIEGEMYYSLEVQEMMEKEKESEVFLTPREEEVMRMICLGHQVSEIASQLFISTETVKSHYKNIRIKLNVKSKSDIIQYARDHLFL
jgi:DNA-binding NarL/FixJ family response regulator